MRFGIFSTIAAVVCVLIAVPAFSQELIGDEINPSPVAKKSEFKGMKNGSLVITPGIFNASSLIGGEFEFGIAKFASVMFGLGLIGGNAGFGFHVLNKEHLNLSINALADYMPGLKSVLPEVSFGIRGFFGKSARVGLGGRIGIAIITNSITVGSAQYTAGSPMLTYCLGVPIRAKY